ncbi:TetR/AcrR family transcriptional regulator [Thalassobacillus sp. C254]|uniref:TetR/AcrR family transcriptional regulator n=1 Tax=Thalassobacillus sp. C254 TaxID=1225341 RepID=UPI0006D21DD4|nr:helix-turn-helix domain-containing protein [Thalassobacillus sp. C254]
MLNSNDRRVARTRTLIRNTFAELIVEKGLDRVTIKDLTERADINRGTFYLHFQDKYDLLEQSEEKFLRE